MSEDKEELCDQDSHQILCGWSKRMEKKWIVRACGTYGRKEKCLQGFG